MRARHKIAAKAICVCVPLAHCARAVAHKIPDQQQNLRFAPSDTHTQAFAKKLRIFSSASAESNLASRARARLSHIMCMAPQTHEKRFLLVVVVVAFLCTHFLAMARDACAI